MSAASSDVGLVEAAAAIELVLAQAYGSLLGLAYVGGASADPFVASFARTTAAQHAAHLQAVQATVTALGGAAQSEPAPQYAGLVDQTLSALKGQPADKGLPTAIGLLLELERVAAQTYVHAAASASDPAARRVSSSVMGVEAQHVAVLAAIMTLLDGGEPQLLALPPDTAALPASLGSAPLPHAFYPTDEALAPPATAPS
jgi:hypothetical protein